MKNESQTKRTYGDIVGDIQATLNNKRNKDNGDDLKRLCIELRTYGGVKVGNVKVGGIELTTKFLRNLLNGLNERQKTQRLYYVLAKADIKKQPINRHTHGFKWETSKADVIEYGYNKHGKAEIKTARLQTIGKQKFSKGNEVLYKLKLE